MKEAGAEGALFREASMCVAVGCVCKLVFCYCDKVCGSKVSFTET